MSGACGSLAAAFIALILSVPQWQAVEAAPVVAKKAVNVPVAVTDNGALMLWHNTIELLATTKMPDTFTVSSPPIIRLAPFVTKILL